MKNYYRTVKGDFLNLSLQNRVLGYAILVSVLIHGVLIFARFVPSRAFHIVPPDPLLEVVLVNAKGKSIPLNPQALAQTSLDGGGKNENVMPKSPLPDSRRLSDGDILAFSERRMEELQKEQKQLAAKLKKELKGTVAAVKEKPSPKEENHDTGIRSDTAARQTIAGRAAAIEKEIAEQGSRPKKVFVTPRTREVGYAMYYKSMQRKIESIGTLNFPQRNGRKLYGELTLLIPVSSDGTLYEREGGPRVERSSGNAALDNAALKIVRRAAPFGPFPPKMRESLGDRIWVMVARFNFTRDNALTTDSQSSN